MFVPTFMLTRLVVLKELKHAYISTYRQNTALYTGWAVSRAPRNYVECDVKQRKINGVEYLFFSFDV